MSLEVKIQVENGKFLLSFPYDARFIRELKTEIPLRKWNPIARNWEVPFSCERQLINFLKLEKCKFDNSIFNQEIHLEAFPNYVIIKGTNYSLPYLLKNFDIISRENNSIKVSTHGFNSVIELALALKLALEKNSLVYNEDFFNFQPKEFQWNLPLFPFQEEALKWCLSRKKSLLALDLGLGKTAIAIKFALELRRGNKANKCLILCPKSLIENWKNEIAKFSNLEVEIIEGKDRKLKFFSEKFFFIMNYEKLLKEEEMIKLVDFDIIIFDESRRIGNPKAKTTKLSKSLKKSYILLLNGRPMENSPIELFSQISFLSDSWPSYYSFLERYAIRGRFNEIISWVKMEEFKEKIQPFIYRKLKSEVLDQLPDIVHINYLCNMNKLQAEEYDKSIYDVLHKMQTGELIEISNILVRLLRVRQAACSAELVSNYKDSCKLNELKEIIKETQEPIFIVTFFAEMAKILGREINNSKVLTGDSRIIEREETIKEWRNGKFQILIATDILSYGQNFQHSSTLVNFEPHWNPGRIDQRIGRLHRIGQKRNKILVINLITAGTIEEYVFKNAQKKNELFENLVGELPASEKISKEKLEEILRGG